MKHLARLALAALILTPSAHAQVAGQPKPPLATLTAGWTYLWADQGANYRSNLNGWFVRPTVYIGRGASIFFSNSNYYGANAKGSLNSHGFTLGVARRVFNIPRIQPSVFLESGDVRASSHGITEEALVATGVGLSIPLAHRLALSITPVEYVFLYPHADWRNDINAKVGITFPFGRR
jgi:hypothetical protein